MSDDTRFLKGLNNYKKLSGNDENIFEPLGDLGKLMLEYGFGDIYGRDTLSWKERQISTMSIQIANGYLPQFKLHVKFSLNIGISIEEIEELIIHCSAYTGFPAVMNAYNALKDVKTELGI